jgi:hypothetical protein
VFGGGRPASARLPRAAAAAPAAKLCLRPRPRAEGARRRRGAQRPPQGDHRRRQHPLQPGGPQDLRGRHKRARDASPARGTAGRAPCARRGTSAEAEIPACVCVWPGAFAGSCAPRARHGRPGALCARTPQECKRTAVTYISPEHILLALLGQSESRARVMLTRWGGAFPPAAAVARPVWAAGRPVLLRMRPVAGVARPDAICARCTHMRARARARTLTHTHTHTRTPAHTNIYTRTHTHTHTRQPGPTHPPASASTATCSRRRPPSA